MANELDISDRCLRRIAKEDLGLKPDDNGSSQVSVSRTGLAERKNILDEIQRATDEVFALSTSFFSPWKPWSITTIGFMALH